MSHPLKLPSGRVVFASIDWKWYEGEATEEEKDALLKYLDVIADAGEEHMKKIREERRGG